MPVACEQTQSRVWSFLLPDAGVHEFQVDNIGQRDQIQAIDGVVLPAPEGTTLFTGPGGSLLEIRQAGGAWQLLVNGFIVEDYNAGSRKKGDSGVRDLKSRPDGSYTISTQLHAAGLGLKVVRKWVFLAQGITHEVEMAHKDWVWQVIHNGVILERMEHSMGENLCHLNFQVEIPQSQQTVEAHMRMEWQDRSKIWNYSLSVNHMPVPFSWTRIGGDVANVTAPEVAWANASATAAPTISEAAPPQFCGFDMQPPSPVAADILPQGVSFDSSCGSYQANIRHGNRFIFLGEFATPEEASARYQEECAKLQLRN